MCTLVHSFGPFGSTYNLRSASTCFPFSLVCRVFVLWAMSVELDMQHLNKTNESGDQIIYFKFFYKQQVLT